VLVTNTLQTTYIKSDSDEPMGDIFTIVAKVRLDSFTPNTNVVCSQWAYANSLRRWRLDVTPSGSLTATVRNQGSNPGATTVVATSTATLEEGVEYFVVMQYSGSNFVRIRVNNSSWNQESVGFTSPTMSQRLALGCLAITNAGNESDINNMFVGRIRQFGIAYSLLSTEQLDYLEANDL
jgi:hypothetical protein